MLRKSVLFLCLFMVVFAGIQVLDAQQIEGEVNIILDRLPLEKQEKLKDLAQDIEIYLTDHDWTGEDFDTPVQVSIQIYLEDKSATHEDRYAGTFVISNNSDVQYSDKYWRFPYQKGEQLIHMENNANPFTGFIDFYVYLLLAHKYDEFGEYMGTLYFQKARNIADQVSYSSQFSYGWKDRIEMASNFTSNDYKPFRKMKDLYYLGMSYFGEEDDTAVKHVREAVLMLIKVLQDNPDHQEAIQFLDAHHIEIIDIFKEDPDLLEQLIEVDPDHEETYKKYL